MFCKEGRKANYIFILKPKEKLPKDKIGHNQGKIILCLTLNSIVDSAKCFVKRYFTVTGIVLGTQ